MASETVTDWLTKNKVSDEDINFIETVLTFTSTGTKLTDKQELINTKLQTLFPNKKVKIKSDLTYQEFVQILNNNDIKVNADELLNKYRSQGICVDLCNKWLTQGR